MKHFGMAIIFSIGMALTACGNNSSNNTINGNWAATLTGTQNIDFNVTLTESGSSSVSVSNLNFTTSQSCFDTGAAANGSFTLTGNTGGVVTGSFQMAIQSGASNTNGTNQLTLQGTLTNNTITGNWTLSGTGSGCTGSGTFTMTD